MRYFLFAGIVGMLLIQSGCYTPEQGGLHLVSEESSQAESIQEVYHTQTTTTPEQEDLYLPAVNPNRELYYTQAATIPDATANHASTAELITALGPQVISSREAEAMMTGENFIILDVRTPEEFEAGHIENAVLLPLGELLERVETVIPNKDHVILIYCRSGNRSNQAAHLLSELGYARVYDFGGIIDWHGEIVLN